MNSAVSTQTVVDILRRARQAPLSFFNTMWPGAEPWQQAAVQCVARFPRTSIVSSNGAGKTWTVGRLAAQHLLSHSPSKVVTTAGTWMQVRRQVWGEISNAHDQLPSWLQLGELNNTDWNLTADWYAVGMSVDRAEHAEGFHSPNTLVIVDEAKVVEEGVFDSINRIFSGRGSPRLLVVSSAGEPRGHHYQSFTEHAGIYARMRVSPYECWVAPPGCPDGAYPVKPTTALSQDYIDTMRDLYGEDSPQFRSMVLALWTEDSSAWCLFPPSVLRDMRDDQEPPHGTKAEIWVGADVARSLGGDESALCAVEQWTEDGMTHCRQRGSMQFRTDDSTEYALRLISFAQEQGARAEHVNVDGTGIGGPTCNICRDRGWRVNCIVASATAEMESPRLANTRAQLWWQGKEMGRQRLLHNVTDEWTRAQLGEPRYGHNSRGEIQIERKEDTAKRVAQSRPRSPWKSPDRADALLLALHRPYRPVLSSLAKAAGYY